MKILIVSHVFDAGYFRGAERVAMNLAGKLGERHDVEILSLGDASGQDRVEDLLVHRLRFGIHPRPAARMLEGGALRKLAWHTRNAYGGVPGAELRACLRTIAPDVVYAHNSTALQPQLFQACAALALPLVLHLHDYSSLCPRTTMYKSGRNCTAPCLSCQALTAAWRRHSAAAGDVIAVSKFVQDRHRQHGAYPKARWHVVHNIDGSDLEGFTRKSTGPFTFGYIGALTPQKGLGDLVSAYAGLCGGAETPLVVAGKGDDGYLTGLKGKLVGRPVTWLGQVAPNDLYSQVDCVIVPSRWHEPQALVVGEALRRGLPVIASDRGGNSEVLGPRSGHLLYDPDAPAALQGAMARMLRERPERASEQLSPDFFERVEDILTKAARSLETSRAQ